MTITPVTPSTTPRPILMRARRDVTADWLAYDPVVPNGQLAVEITVGGAQLLKCGDGTSTWTELDYLGSSEGSDGEDGEDGTDGIDGVDGRGIVSIARTSGTGAAGTVDTYTITYDASPFTSTFQVWNGSNGTDGTDGEDGTDGTDGTDGRGIVSWVQTDGDGSPGSLDEYTITYTDFTTDVYTVYNGEDGADGAGTGDVVGPASSVNLRIAVFDGTDGKEIADGGVLVADLQPKDTDLTAIAALTTTSYGRDLLTLADQAALVALLPSYQPIDSDLTSIAALTTTSYGRAFLELANQAALVALLPSYQPLDTDLTTIAGLTATTDNFMVASGSAWASRTPSQARTHMGLATVASSGSASDLGTGILINAVLPARIRNNTNGNRFSTPNSSTDTSWGYVNASTNGPEGATISSYMLMTISDTGGTDKYSQIAFEIGASGRTWTRNTSNGSTWTSWVRQATTADLVAAASETVAGKAELATQAETNTGTDDARIVTPLKLQTRMAAYAEPAARTINAQTGTSYTLVLADAGAVVTMSNSSANTLTIPLNSSVAFPIGTYIEIYNNNTGDTTLTPTGGVTLNSAAGLKLTDQYAGCGIRKVATDTWQVAGRTST